MATGHSSTFPLSMAGEHVPVRVVALAGGAGLNKRMTELGMNVGAELVIRQRQGAGLVIARGETRFALGGGMANRIIVTQININQIKEKHDDTRTITSR